jgi:hypothetical protein
MSPMEFSMRLSETLDKLTSIAKEDKRDLVPKVLIKLLAQLREIRDKLRRLLIKFKSDFNSVSLMINLLRFRQTL